MSAPPSPPLAGTVSVPSAEPLVARCMVLSVGRPDDAATLASGPCLAEALAAAGHVVLGHQQVAPEVAAVRARVLDAVESGEVEVLLLAGGTGIAPHDVTPDAVVPLFGKRLAGFGEIYRQLAFAAEGPVAVLARADAGVITRTLVFLMPGSAAACRRAVDQLIAPLLPHALAQLRAHRT